MAKGTFYSKRIVEKAGFETKNVWRKLERNICQETFLKTPSRNVRGIERKDKKKRWTSISSGGGMRPHGGFISSGNELDGIKVHRLLLLYRGAVER
jgi:hypothetical protein